MSFSHHLNELMRSLVLLLSVSTFLGTCQVYGADDSTVSEDPTSYGAFVGDTSHEDGKASVYKGGTGTGLNTW